MDISAENFFIQIYKSNSLLTDILKNICKKYDINNLQLYIIVISSYKPINVSMLAEILNITKSAVSQALVNLFIRRIVVKKPCEEDRKIYFIKTTAKGTKIKNAIMQYCTEKYQKMLAEIGEDEMTKFIELSTKLNKRLEQGKIEKEEENA